MSPDQILYINAKDFLNKPVKFVDGDDHNLIHHMTEFAKTKDCVNEWIDEEKIKF